MTKLTRILLLFVVFISLKFLTGCSGSEPQEESEATKRIKDSTKIYMAFESARLSYVKALQHNEQANSKSSAEDFESAAKQLNKIDQPTLEKHPNWKKDFTELATSIVQDYLTAIEEIDSKSKVFSLAKKLNISYEKIENKTYSNVFNPSDLPKGEEVKIENNHSAVQDYLNYFTNGGKKYMDKWLYRSGKYYNLMRAILRENNAPEELVYLATIESGLDPKISSHAGAIGLWQFMPTTGSAYGLYYDSNTDDKRDIEKSTDAAARHLLDLYKSFGDWYLAMASYNAGPGRITSAIKKSGSTDFWTIRNYLPKETQNYVPQFIATGLINLNPKEYGFTDVEYGTPIEYDRAIIKAQISTQRIAELCNTDVETIRDLNSQMLQDVTPLFTDGYLIRIPKGSFKEFAKNYESASDFEKNDFKPAYDGNEGTSVKDNTSSFTYYKVSGYEVEDRQKIASQLNRDLMRHKVDGGEELTTIASKYEVRASDLRIWNNINYGKYPKTGDELSVWLTRAKYNELNGVKEEKKDDGLKDNNQNNEKTDNSTQNDSKETTEKKDAEDILVNKEHRTDTENSTNENTETKETVKKEKTTKKETKTKKSSYQTYTVKSGDNLAEIADSYDVSVSDIKDWNDLESDKILVGQKLKIYSDKKITTSGKNKSKQTYTVKEGDNLTAIANEFDVSVSLIKEWNNLDDDVIYSGQILKLYSDKKTTKEKSITKKKQKSYTVQSGDNLTMIADKFNVSVSEIREWNGLKSDVIQEGQVLKLYSTKDTKTKETKKKTEYYTVKSGDTLAKIADKYNCSLVDLKRLNNLKSDEIVIGQKLRVSK